MGRSTFFKILRNPYYIGLVPYKGATHPRGHEPLIDISTWQRVQTILDTAKAARARKRTYDHYLKGSLFCGACGSRLQLDLPKNKQGIRYAYFACTGRRKRTTACTRRAIPVTVAERLVADCYSRISISEAQYADLAKQVEAAFDERFAARSDELAELTANRRRLEAESDKILAAHFADAIDLDTLKRHQDRIRTGLADIDRRIAAEHSHDRGPRKQIARALRLLVNCQQLYKNTDAHGKRLANQTFTNGIEIDEDEEHATLRLAEPFAVATSHNTHVRHVTTSEIVGLRREFENIGPALKTVASRWSRGSYRKSKRPVEPPVVDARGRLVRSVGMAQTFLKPEQVDELVALYRQGWTLVRLAERFGIHKRTAAAHLVRRSVPIRGKGLAEEDRAEAARLYEDGATLLDVGLRFGVSQQAVRRALVTLGVKIRPSCRRSRRW